MCSIAGILGQIRPKGRNAVKRILELMRDRGPGGHGLAELPGALLINLNTIHRSGFNQSDRIRFSAICRYHRMTADDYVPFRQYYIFNEYLVDRVLEMNGDDPVTRKIYDLG